MKLVIDAYGGDNAPHNIIDGIIEAMKSANDFTVILTGDEGDLSAALAQKDCDMSRITLLHAPQIISCNEQPMVAIKQKSDSSLVAALNVMARREADCMISAGSTGALLMGATFIVKRITGVKRPAIAPLLPTLSKPVLLIDSGANADCKPEFLYQFAIMGSAYMQGVMGINEPSVALINNGEEEAKGNELTKRAYSLIANASVNFVGNCEARDIFSGNFDVLVCDGFTGNVILKEAEGFASVLFRIIKSELTSGFMTNLGAALIRPALMRVKKRMDYSEYGGAPLLGIDGGVIKAHGSSNARAICSAIRQARAYVNGNVTELIRQGIASSAQTGNYADG